MFKRRETERNWKIMELQTTTLPVTTDIQIIGAFILGVVGIEILLIFIGHSRKNPGSSAGWIWVFAIFAGEFTVGAIIELIALLLITDPITEQTFMNYFNVFAMDIECILLFGFLFSFTKKRRRPATLLCAGIIVGYLSLLAVQLLEVIFTKEIINMLGLDVMAAFLPTIIFPVMIAERLDKQAEIALMKNYHDIIIAMVIVGMGELLHFLPIEQALVFLGVSDGIVVFLSVFSRIAGIGLLFIGFYFMPYIEDLNWQRDLMAVYVIETNSKEVLYKEMFAENIGIESMYSGTAEQDHAILGSFSGLDDFVSEVIKSPGGNLEFIDKGGIKFLFARHKNLLFVATSKKNRPEIRAKLVDFGDWFFIHFGELVKNNILDPMKYVKAHDVATDVFKRTKI